MINGHSRVWPGWGEGGGCDYYIGTLLNGYLSSIDVYNVVDNLDSISIVFNVQTPLRAPRYFVLQILCLLSAPHH